MSELHIVSKPNRGILIENSDPDIGTYHTAILDLAEVQALREFFQAERDEEDWQLEDYPGWVAWSAPGDWVVARYVPTGEVWRKHRTDTRTRLDTQISFDFMQAFFAAHSEPKPWDGAKPGELWLFTSHTGYQAPYRMTEAGNFNHAVTGNRISLDRMVDARLMWPCDEEVTPDE